VGEKEFAKHTEPTRIRLGACAVHAEVRDEIEKSEFSDVRELLLRIGSH
jgi:CO/xanthine dehydrogenase FAD-binding subunit